MGFPLRATAAVTMNDIVHRTISTGDYSVVEDKGMSWASAMVSVCEVHSDNLNKHDKLTRIYPSPIIWSASSSSPTGTTGPRRRSSWTALTRRRRCSWRRGRSRNWGKLSQVGNCKTQLIINRNSKALFTRFGELLQRSNLGGDPRLQAEDGLNRVPALGHRRQIPLRAPNKVSIQNKLIYGKYFNCIW